MAASDTAITLAMVVEWEAPDGDVRLSDGGVVKFDPGDGEVTYSGEDSVFGTVASVEVFESGVGDMVEGGNIVFAPNGSATLSDWWRADLENTRLRIWLGEIDSDGISLTGEDLLADWLVDTTKRVQGDSGAEALDLDCMSRMQKLFETSQGNVCSDRFHTSIWSGERGFENCHDGPQYFAWGTDNPSGGSNSNGTGGGGNGSTRGGPYSTFAR